MALKWIPLYKKISDATCSAATIRRHRKEWIAAGLFETLEQICLDNYDRIVGRELDGVCTETCFVKAPYGDEVAGRSPVDRSKYGAKRPVMTDASAVLIGVVAAPANCND
ncbi:hypothetical protein A6F49_01355 [Enteractinococcus helveticum]|uniref:Transposase n=1 Tax=Enteractinococcus helveticum TaxID=1837282 RepID=A0A1B7LV80_9MICC|nr:hypothetical protein A6F49_01355 [Enteractinococcus helveticum]